VELVWCLRPSLPLRSASRAGIGLGSEKWVLRSGLLELGVVTGDRWTYTYDGMEGRPMRIWLTADSALGGFPLEAPAEKAGAWAQGSPSTGGAARRGKYSEYLALRSEVLDLEKALDARRRATHRHFFWAVLGLSPAAFLPMMGLLRGGGLVLVVVLGALVSVVELIRGIGARRSFYATLNEFERGRRRLAELGPF